MPSTIRSSFSPGSPVHASPQVPADKLSEVSFAYCFICLLHLANEKSLEVLGEGDMKDMRIRLPTK